MSMQYNAMQRPERSGGGAMSSLMSGYYNNRAVTNTMQRERFDEMRCITGPCHTNGWPK